jgi:hypothetical protein
MLIIKPFKIRIGNRILSASVCEKANTWDINKVKIAFDGS